MIARRTRILMTRLTGRGSGTRLRWEVPASSPIARLRPRAEPGQEARQQRGPGHDGAEVQPLVQAVGTGPDRPEPVDRRRAGRGGDVGVAAPAGRLVADAEPE